MTARLTIEGDQAFITDLGFAIRRRHGPENFTRFEEESLGPPPLEYEPGDVARIGGMVALRTAHGWGFADGSRLRDDELAGRQPTPLVLKGVPVNAA